MRAQIISDLNHILEQQNQMVGVSKLVAAGQGLAGSDNRPLFQNAYLHMSGALFNAGTITAGNVVIHVKAYQPGGITILNADINLGDIPGQSGVLVDKNTNYAGPALSNWAFTIDYINGSTGSGAGVLILTP